MVLVEPEIHWNTGNVGRTCLATGATLHLVEPLGFSLDAKQVRRAGLDYWPRVPLRRWPSWAALEPELPSLGAPYLISPDAERTVWDVRFEEPAVLVFGRESAGLPSSMRRAYRDRLLSIPMRDPALRSLNLSTAVAVASYEVLRQRRAAGAADRVC